jgi:hypothetical protein
MFFNCGISIRRIFNAPQNPFWHINVANSKRACSVSQRIAIPFGGWFSLSKVQPMPICLCAFTSADFAGVELVKVVRRPVIRRDAVLLLVHHSSP